MRTPLRTPLWAVGTWWGLELCGQLLVMWALWAQSGQSTRPFPEAGNLTFYVKYPI